MPGFGDTKFTEGNSKFKLSILNSGSIIFSKSDAFQKSLEGIVVKTKQPLFQIYTSINGDVQLLWWNAEFGYFTNDRILGYLLVNNNGQFFDFYLDICGNQLKIYNENASSPILFSHTQVGLANLISSSDNDYGGNVIKLVSQTENNNQCENNSEMVPFWVWIIVSIVTFSMLCLLVLVVLTASRNGREKGLQFVKI